MVGIYHASYRQLLLFGIYRGFNEITNGARAITAYVQSDLFVSRTRNVLRILFSEKAFRICARFTQSAVTL